MMKFFRHSRARLGTLIACLALTLLAPRMPVAAPSDDRAGAMFTAIRRGDADAVQELLLRGASPNVSDPGLGPAIVYAATQGGLPVVKALLLSPATDLEARNAAGETALMHAAGSGDRALVELLVSRRAEVNQPGWTALHYAAANGHLEIVRYLLEHSAYIDAPSPNGTTPLMLAARQQRLTVVSFLVEEGADPTLRNEAGFDAATYLERNGDLQRAEAMRARARAFEQRHGKPMPDGQR